MLPVRDETLSCVLEIPLLGQFGAANGSFCFEIGKTALVQSLPEDTGFAVLRPESIRVNRELVYLACATSENT